jgi:thioredoxin-related protein
MKSWSNQVKGVIFLLSMFLFVGISYAQTTVNWLTWEEALERSQIEKRKFFVDVYTDWCGWCKKMDKATFQKPEIAEYLNQNYYSIKFNAEQKGEINLNDKLYKFVKSGKNGYHELAVEITYGKLSYPTIVFLDENAKVIQPISGYKDAKMFKMIMSYFAEDHFKTTPWKKFAATRSH